MARHRLPAQRRAQRLSYRLHAHKMAVASLACTGSFIRTQMKPPVQRYSASRVQTISVLVLSSTAARIACSWVLLAGRTALRLHVRREGRNPPSAEVLRELAQTIVFATHGDVSGLSLHCQNISAQAEEPSRESGRLLQSAQRSETKHGTRRILPETGPVLPRTKNNDMSTAHPYICAPRACRLPQSARGTSLAY